MNIRGLSNKDNELLTRVDEVLHYLWDPIGVSDIPEARDEYSSYAGVVLSMLKRGANSEEISNYLRDLRIINMGIGHVGDKSNEDEIVEIITNWKETILDE
jgi:hypothetical protein